MKCDYCGANVTIDDRECPYCHKLNTHYVKHREDMFHYEEEYRRAKQDIYERAGKVSRVSARVAILAVMAVLAIGLVVVQQYSWDIARMMERSRIERNLSYYISTLEQYLEEGNYQAFDEFYEANQLNLSDRLWEEYGRVKNAGGHYVQVLSACGQLVEAEKNPDAYYTSDQCIQDIAENLYSFYQIYQPDNFYYEDYEKHALWYDAMRKEAEALVQTYVGVSAEEMNGFVNLSETKILVALERNYEERETVGE